MNIDERLLAYKPISITLNFDWDNTTLDERAQMRWDYIQEQKKKDPNYVGYDFPEHFSSTHGKSNISLESCDKRKLISTIGQVIFIRYNELRTSFGSVGPEKYRTVIFRINQRSLVNRLHRVVGCTFIPVPKDLFELKTDLVINHKNDNRLCNFVSNLEWCTSGVNTLKAVETGALKSRGLKFTITLPGEHRGKVYYFLNRDMAEEYGFRAVGLTNSLNLNMEYLFGVWSYVTREFVLSQTLGIPKEMLDVIRDPKLGRVNATATVGTIVTEGPCKGQRFAIFGSAQIKEIGFERPVISFAIRDKTISQSCTWERMTREEAVNIPIGLTEAQREHIFGKDTNK